MGRESDFEHPWDSGRGSPLVVSNPYSSPLLLVLVNAGRQREDPASGKLHQLFTSDVMVAWRVSRKKAGRRVRDAPWPLRYRKGERTNVHESTGPGCP